MEDNPGEFMGPSGHDDGWSSHNSFPSGHATAAFAVATVLSERTHRKWVRWTGYGIAGLISYARVAGEKHYLGDVAAGGVLGFCTGRIVLARHARAVDLARARALEHDAGSTRADVRGHPAHLR